MEETKNGLGLRAAFGVLAVAMVAAALWAASAFAAGGSTSSERGTSDDPAAYVQNERGAPDHDCPERDGDSEDSSDA